MNPLLVSIIDALQQNEGADWKDNLKPFLKQIDANFYENLAEQIRLIGKGDASDRDQSTMEFFLQLPELIISATIKPEFDRELEAVGNIYDQYHRFFSSGLYDKALAEAAELIRIGQKISHPSLQYSGWMFSGQVYEKKENLRQTAESYQNAWKSIEGKHFWSKSCAVLYSLGRTLTLIGETEKSRETFSTLIQEANFIGFDQYTATAYYELGVIDIVEGMFDEAKVQLNKALEIAEPIPDLFVLGAAHMNLGNIAMIQKDERTALDHYHRGLEILKGSKHHHLIENLQNGIRKIEGSSDAVSSLENALKLEASAQQAIRNQEFEIALSLRHQSLAIVRKIGDYQNQVVLLGKIANLHWEILGLYQEALPYLNEALEIAKLIADFRLQSWIYSLIAQVKKKIGAIDDARANFENALKTGEKSGDNSTYAQVLNSAGNDAKYDGRYWEATGFYEKSLAIAQKTGDDEGQVLALGNLGNVRELQSDYETAGGFYERGLKLAKKIGYSQGIMNQTINLGNIHYQNDRFEPALGYYEQAKGAAQATGNPNFLGRCWLNMGRCYLGLRQFEAAINALNNAAKFTHEQDDAVMPLIRNGLSQALMAMGRFDDAEREWRLSLQSIENHADDSFQYQSDINVFDDFADHFYKRIEAVSETIGAESVFMLIEEVKSKAYRAFHKTGLPDFPQIQEFLNTYPSETAFVHLVLFRESLLLVTLKNDGTGPQIQRVNISMDQISDAYNRFLREVDEHLAYPELDETWYYLLEDLGRAILQACASCKLVCFCPNFISWLFPIHALRVDEKPLLRYFPVSYTDCFSRLYHSQKKERRRKTDSSFIAGTSLTATDDVYFEGEAKMVAQMFGGTAFLGRSVTRQLLLDEMPGKDLIHLSMHGEWQQNGTKLILNFETEYLEGNDLHRITADAGVVFLSGCNSSWFNPDKLKVAPEGFPTLFLNAGAESVIAPGWSITGAASLQIVYHFYQHLLAGVSRAEALQKAQLAILEKNYYRQHSFYWAPFSLFGNSN